MLHNPGALYGNPPNISTPENFDQWYWDDPESDLLKKVNLSKTMELVLKRNNGTGTYLYNSADTQDDGISHFDPFGPTGGWIALGYETPTCSPPMWRMGSSQRMSCVTMVRIQTRRRPGTTLGFPDTTRAASWRLIAETALCKKMKGKSATTETTSEMTAAPRPARKRSWFSFSIEMGESRRRGAWASLCICEDSVKNLPIEGRVLLGSGRVERGPLYPETGNR